MQASAPKSWTRRYVLWGGVTLLGGALIAIAILGVVWWSMAQMGSVKSFAAPGQIVYAAATTDSVTIWPQ
ncbi:MAG TPA: hypothetical protein VHC70_09375, partial [Phycisphaerales bacterium]|nr:hypothetical protein [Phycisphaerales bacterium]